MEQNKGYFLNEDNDLLVADLPSKENMSEQERELNFWLMENIKIMEQLTIKEPSSWTEQDWGG